MHFKRCLVSQQEALIVTQIHTMIVINAAAGLLIPQRENQKIRNDIKQTLNKDTFQQHSLKIKWQQTDL